MKIHGDPPTDVEWRAAGLEPIDPAVIEAAFTDVIQRIKQRDDFAPGPRARQDLRAIERLDLVQLEGEPQPRPIRTTGAAAEYTLRELAVVGEDLPLDYHKLRVALLAVLRGLDRLVQEDPGIAPVPVGPAEILPPQWTPRYDEEGRPQGEVRVRFIVLGRIAPRPDHPSPQLRI